jgi:pimeloyl-ACP methyl ester carboxylesterase
VGALLANDDPSRVGPLLRGLGPIVLARLEGLSPSVAAPGIRAPVVAMHSTEDAAVPPAELLRLAAALPRAEVIRVSGFEHVDLAGGWLDAAGDLWRASRFGARLLEAG